MRALAVIYKWFCRIQEAIVAVFIVSITFLIFVSAIARSLNYPLNWAPDTALLLLAWVVFLGADIALRRSDFIRVDILFRRFPVKIRKFLYYLYYVAVIMFLGLLVRFGIPLAIDNYRRTFQALEISYFWATISAPVGASFMILTIILKLIKKWNVSDPQIEEPA
ncbi:MAG: TRAP transporter small permease subunit [Treponema sp.]|nr:TRAP transporter small permease subunit [Treponema sp.]